MHKVSIVGIDNAGKSSMVQSLGKIDNVSTIRLTGGMSNRSRTARVVHRLAEIGESRNLKFVTGFAYFLHLFPYFLEQRANKEPVLISDRDPIVDTVCYADFYLPKGLSKVFRPPLKFVLERWFGYPDSFCYLDVSPEIAAQRTSSRQQLHERLQSLRRLKELFEEEMLLAENRNVRVIRVDANTESLEDAINEILSHIQEQL
jgi:thymidylate kinase